MRCAIYTRQSVARADEDFTSREAQRERCEDYVRAMRFEGWTFLDDRFDDLGESGGGLDNADDVLRSYRCRGDAARPACSPPVQVAARHVEARVLTVLREAHISWVPDDRSRGFLEWLAPAWASFDAGERRATVRGLVWAADWDRDLGLTKLVLDELTVDAFIEREPDLAAQLPARPD